MEQMKQTTGESTKLSIQYGDTFTDTLQPESLKFVATGLTWKGNEWTDFATFYEFKMFCGKHYITKTAKNESYIKSYFKPTKKFYK